MIAPPGETSPKRRWKRVALFASGGLLALLALAVLGAVFLLRGRPAGGLVTDILAGVLPGKLTIQSIDWEARILADLVTNAPTPIAIGGIELRDPEGRVVLKLPRLTLKVPPRSAMNAQVLLHDVVIGPDAHWVFGDQKEKSGIGFLKALIPESSPPPPGAPPPPAAEPSGGEAAPAFVFKIVNADLVGLTAEFDFPGSWGVLLRNIHGKANFTIDGDFVGFDAYDLQVDEGGHLIVLTEKLPFDKVHIPRVATLREYRNDIFLDLAAGHTGRSILSGKGFFRHIYDDGESGIDMHAEFAHAADALGAVASAHQPELSGLQISGDDAHVSVDLKEPFSRIAIDGLFADLDVAFDGRAARDLDFDLHFVAAPLLAEVKAMTFQDPQGGGAKIGVKFEDRAAPGAEAKMHLAASVGLDGFHTGSYVPPALRALLGGRADGQLEARMNLAEGRLDATIPRLRLQRTRMAGLPRTITVSGNATAAGLGAQGFETVETKGLRVAIPGATAHARGRVHLLEQAVSLSVRAAAGNLPLVLRPFGLPALADRARVSAQVSGKLDNPTVVGNAVIENAGAGLSTGTPLPVIPELKASFGLKNGVARLQELEASLLGGQLVASGQAQLFRGSFARMLRQPIVDIRVHGEGLRLQDVLADAPIAGALTFDAEAKGPANRLKGKLALPDGTELQILGQAWALSGLQVEIADDVLTLSTTRLSRNEGGAVELTGRLALKGPMQMGWHLVINDFPLAGIPGVSDAGIALGGSINVDLNLAGSISQPTATGTISVKRVTVGGADMGDIELALDASGPPGAPGVRLTGHVFEIFAVEASGTFTPRGPDVLAKVSFEKLAVEKLLPKILLALSDPAKGPARIPPIAEGVTAGLTGNVTVAVTPDKPLSIDLLLTQLLLVGKAATPQGEIKTVTLENEGNIRASVVGDQITLRTTKLVTEGGQLMMGGTLYNDKLTTALDGELDLAVLQPILQPFLQKTIQDLQGVVAIAIRTRGALAMPTVEGKIEIKRTLSARHPTLDTPIEIPSGVIKVYPTAVELSKLALRVGESNLVLDGRADFSTTFEVKKIAAEARGQLDARLLAVVAPDAVTESSGTFAIQGRVSGTPGDPLFDAKVNAKDVLLRLREPRQRLLVESAQLDFHAREATLTNVRVIVDDTGLLTIGAAGDRAGSIVFEQLLPTLKVRHASLPLRGEHLSFRSPGVLEIDDLGFTMELSGDLDRNTLLSGEVRVLSGRVVWDFNVSDFALSPRIVEGYGRPAARNPFLDNMKLDLNVRTIGDTFLVQNNIAPELYMMIDVYVGGTATNPTIAGGLFPTDGRFRIIGMRGDFDLVVGANQITFEPTRSLADLETPWLKLEASNVVTDTSGNTHEVLMRINGPVGQAQLEFSTDTGLTQNQTLLLLLSGNPTQGTARFGTSTPTLAGNVNTGFDIASQTTRDVFATMLEPYVADTLALLTGSRLNLRPTIGPDGVELRLFGRFSRQLRLQIDYLQGFQNDRRARADASLWLADYMTLRSFGEHLQLSPQPGITETFNSVNLELMLEWPIRFPRP